MMAAAALIMVALVFLVPFLFDSTWQPADAA
jgi:hypothetical protein